MKNNGFCVEFKRSNSKRPLRQALLVAYLPQNTLQLKAISIAQNLQLQAAFTTHNLQLIRTSFKQQSVVQVWSLYEICQGQRFGLYHVTRTS